MALPIPNLDDRKFNDLIKEFTALIPIYSKEWTNHNPSDPGVTLLELFAWLGEALIYRTNQIPEETYRRFLKLIGIDYLFCWDLIPGSESSKLIDFLKQSYGFSWVKRAQIEKSPDGQSLFIKRDDQNIQFTLNKAQNVLQMNYGNGNTTDFIVKKVFSRLFDWDKVPGQENYCLIDFLTQYYAANWVKNAKIEKDPAQDTIVILDDLNTITLQNNTQDLRRVTMSLNIGNRYRIVLRDEPEKLFDWDRIPGSDADKLKGFLERNFQVTWKAVPNYIRDANNKMLVVQGGLYPMVMSINDEEERVTISFSGTEQYVFNIQQATQLIFNWDSDETFEKRRLVSYLVRNYGTLWIKNAIFKLDRIDKKINISNDLYSIEVRLNTDKTITDIYFKAGSVFEFPIRKQPEVLFDWDQVPGNDSKRLLKYLTENYNNADWLPKAIISKVDTQTIKVADGVRNIIIQRNADGDQAIVTINTGNIYKFWIKKRTGFMINWEQITLEDRQRILDFLVQKYGLAWLPKAEVLFDKDKKLVTVIENPNIKPENYRSITLRFDEDSDLATFMFNTGTNQYQFDLTLDAGRLEVYQDLQQDIRRGVQSITERYRAITADDFQLLACECMDKLKSGLGQEGRAICINNVDLEYGSPDVEKPGHVSVMIIPKMQDFDFIWENTTQENHEDLLVLLEKLITVDWLTDNLVLKKEPTINGELLTITSGSNSISLELDQDLNKVILKLSPYLFYDLPVKIKNKESWVFGFCANEGKPTQLLRAKVLEYLEKRRLITTRVHVIPPDFKTVPLGIKLVLLKNINENEVLQTVKATINRYFDPFSGGTAQNGWSIGRSLYRSEVYFLLENIPGVDYVSEVLINGNPDLSEFSIGKAQLLNVNLSMKTEKRYHD